MAVGIFRLIGLMLNDLFAQVLNAPMGKIIRSDQLTDTLGSKLKDYYKLCM